MPYSDDNPTLSEQIDDQLRWREEVGPILREANELARENKQLRQERDALRDASGKLLSSLDALIDESGGVYGLHHNGDNAPWEELLAGGQFESWLRHIETLRTTLARQEKP